MVVYFVFWAMLAWAVSLDFRLVLTLVSVVFWGCLLLVLIFGGFVGY